jgi:hypothetical protein
MTLWAISNVHCANVHQSRGFDCPGVKQFVPDAQRVAIVLNASCMSVFPQ